MLTFSAKDISHISTLAQSYAICNGLVLRVKKSHQEFAKNAMVVTHAPVTLYPSIIPSPSFEHVVSLAPLLNKMVDKMARDVEFIKSELKDCAESDSEFTGKLFQLFLNHHHHQPLYLGLHRSDYMLHDQNKSQLSVIPFQVELNTIASSQGCVSTKTYQMHSFLISKVEKLNKYFNEKLKGKHKPIDATNNLVKAMNIAHVAFLNQQNVKEAVILFVVQSEERNVADQKHLEHTLFETYNITVVRLSLAEIIEQCELNDHYQLILKETKQIISLAYFRAGYTPDDYPSESEWKAREMVESSVAIKCPSISYHLIGTKKIQQVMAVNGVLEKYLTKEESDLVRSCFTGIYSLDDTEENNERIQDAIKNFQSYVLKPQREGGGNLVHGEQMRDLLEKISEKDRKKYILMKRICPRSFKSHIMRDGEVAHGECISELGIFGMYLGDGKEELLNEYGGYILRTKFENVEDGGVASGVASLDSAFCVDP